MELFCIKSRNLWGDYGHILAAGVYNLDKQGYKLLHRTGPFLPPISFPFGPAGTRVIISDDFRRSLQKAGFPSLEFRKAFKNRIVALNWHKWDRSSESPQEFPEEGEPEEYIWDKRHNYIAAWFMPKAWELIPPLIRAEFEEMPENKQESNSSLRAILPRQAFPPWFRTREEFGDQVLSAQARSWVEKTIGEWVSFEPLQWRFKDQAPEESSVPK